MSRKIRLTYLGAILALLFLLVSCNQTPAPGVSPASTPVEGPSALESILPTPNPEAATVTGRMVGLKGNGMSNIVVFLEHATEDHQVPPVLYAPPNDQPQAVTNDEGEFTIANVPPGEYVVIAFLPPADIQVFTKPNSDEVLMINARPGKVFNIGIVQLPY